jgi:hypothetical protein
MSASHNVDRILISLNDRSDRIIDLKALSVIDRLLVRIGLILHRDNSETSLSLFYRSNLKTATSSSFLQKAGNYGRSPSIPLRNPWASNDNARANASLNVEVELTGVEPVSKLGISIPIVHRFSFSNPRSGNRSLSRTAGCSGKVFAKSSTRDGDLAQPLGVAHNP